MARLAIARLIAEVGAVDVDVKLSAFINNMKNYNGQSLMRNAHHYIVALLLLMLVSACSQPTTETGQYYYDSESQAATALVDALNAHDTAMLKKVLGENYAQIIPLDDAEQIKEKVNEFLTAWELFHALMMQNENTAIIEVGEKRWHFPIPIIKEDKGWRFDVIAGVEEIQRRRIGRNELSVMQAVFAYSDAQKEYIQNDHDKNGVLEYAQKFISDEGMRNGLYWPDQEGEPLSPLGPLFADVSPGDSYHGYHYKILTAQGEHGAGGAYRYIVNNNMISGYAIIAWPAEYGVSGVMSFMLSRNGILLESNLGPNGAEFAKSLSRFNPDENWLPVADEFLVE